MSASQYHITAPSAASVPLYSWMHYVFLLYPVLPLGIVMIVLILVGIIVLQAKAAISLRSIDLILILHASVFRPETYLGYYALLGRTCTAQLPLDDRCVPTCP